MFQAPYVCSAWPYPRGWISPNVYDLAAIVSKDVNVYADTSIQSPEVSKLSYSIVALDRESWKYGRWVRIITMDGKPGYILEKQCYSPVGYRAYFEKVDDHWQIKYFVVGD